MPKVLKPVHNPAIPFSQEIRGVYAGRFIYVYGSVPDNATRFHINLMAGDDIALHFNPRFNEDCVVRNSRLAGWGPEERGGGLPIKAGEIFDVLILMKKNVFKFFVNGKPWQTYKQRTDLKNITDVQIAGDVEVKRVQFEEKDREWYPAAQIQNPGVGNKIEIPYANMWKHKLIVEGAAKGGRFSINFFDRNDNNLFHFNPREEQNTIVCNSKFGSWQNEERHSAYPFHADNPYIVKIAVNKNMYKVKVNGLDVLTYNHRNNPAGPSDITHVAVHGDTDLRKITFI